MSYLVRRIPVVTSSMIMQFTENMNLAGKDYLISKELSHRTAALQKQVCQIPDKGW